jgi:chromosomal replication initiator protein
MITINDIKQAVAEEWRVSMNELLSERRGRHVSVARQAGYMLARDLTPYSFPRIARGFARIDHTTVMHGIRATENRVNSDPDFAKRVNAVRARLAAKADV